MFIILVLKDFFFFFDNLTLSTQVLNNVIMKFKSFNKKECMFDMLDTGGINKA